MTDETDATELRRLQGVIDAGRADLALDDATRERLWGAVSGASRNAAEQMQRRAAWRTIFHGPRMRLALAAAALVLVTVGVLLLASSMNEDRDRDRDRDKGGGKEGILVKAPGRVEAPGHFEAPITKKSGPTPVARRAPAPAPAPVARKAPVRVRSASQVRGMTCGARVEVRSGGFAVVRDTRSVGIVRLEAGHVALRVPRLPAGGRFEVVTPDARVVVVGTRFSVSREGGAKAGTTVSVVGGTVRIEPAGRGRSALILRAGDRRTVPGEVSYLAELLEAMDRAIVERRFKEAVRVGKRYLEVSSQPGRAAAVRLRLAGAHVQLGQLDQGARLYREVSKGSQDRAAQENALALLARLQQRRGDKPGAVRSWKLLLARFPGGIHRREGLLWLVRLTCKERSGEARGYRRELARCCSADGPASALLRACGAEDR